MLAFAARAVVLLVTATSLITPARAEPHQLSPFPRLAPLVKRDVFEDVACILGAKSACLQVNLDTSDDVNNCEWIPSQAARTSSKVDPSAIFQGGSVGHKCPTTYYNGAGSVSCIDSLCVVSPRPVSAALSAGELTSPSAVNLHRWTRLQSRSWSMREPQHRCSQLWRHRQRLLRSGRDSQLSSREVRPRLLRFGLYGGHDRRPVCAG